MENLGSRIQLLREEKGYTQEELAAMLFVSRQTISNYERNKSQPSLEMLERLAGALDTDMASLLSAPRDKKRDIRPLLLEGSVCLVLLSAYIVLNWVAAVYMREHFDASPLYWVRILLRPGLWAAFGCFLMSVLTTAANISVKQRKWFRPLRLLILLIIAFYLVVTCSHPVLSEVSRKWSSLVYWILGAKPNHPFPQAYLAVAFTFGAALRILRPQNFR